MTREQELAATQLLRAFRKCQKAGLNGGVFDGSVCLWPKEHHEEIMEAGPDFFHKVDEHGQSFVINGMVLDGGAGT